MIRAYLAERRNKIRAVDALSVSEADELTKFASSKERGEAHGSSHKQTNMRGSVNPLATTLPRAYYRGTNSSTRICHYCNGPIPDDEGAIEAKTKNAWAHFECWYDGVPFAREAGSGILIYKKSHWPRSRND